MKKKDLDQIKKELTAPRKIETAIAADDLLSTGSTLLNLALSGKIRGGIAKGFIALLIGRPKSGKSWLSFNVMAEAARSKEFADYRLIYDNIENGAHMDVKEYFGAKLLSKLEPPRGTKKDPICSTTVEEFYYHVDDALADKKPFIYVLDSMDGLSCEADDEQFKKEKSASRRDKKDAGGSYGMGKAKANSRNLRVVANKIAKKKSILIVICQTRANIGYAAQFNPDTHAGGKALEFYARLVVWTSTVSRIKEPVRGKQIDVGGITQAKVTKNSITGWEGCVEFPILRQVGIDDIGSMIDFLVEWKHWKKADGVIIAKELGVALSREELIQKIETENSELDLKCITADLWTDIEADCRPNRKRRYE